MFIKFMRSLQHGLPLSSSSRTSKANSSRQDAGRWRQCSALGAGAAGAAIFSGRSKMYLAGSALLGGSAVAAWGGQGSVAADSTKASSDVKWVQVRKGHRDCVARINQKLLHSCTRTIETRFGVVFGSNIFFPPTLWATVNITHIVAHNAGHSQFQI